MSDVDAVGWSFTVRITFTAEWQLYTITEREKLNRYSSRRRWASEGEGGGRLRQDATGASSGKSYYYCYQCSCPNLKNNSARSNVLNVKCAQGVPILKRCKSRRETADDHAFIHVTRFEVKSNYKREIHKRNIIRSNWAQCNTEWKEYNAS